MTLHTLSTLTREEQSMRTFRYVASALYQNGEITEVDLARTEFLPVRSSICPQKEASISEKLLVHLVAAAHSLYAYVKPYL